MGTSVKVIGFALGLVAVFVVAVGLGRAIGPTGETAAPPVDPGHGDTHPEPPAEPDQPGPGVVPGGLMVSQDGYHLELSDRQLPAARDTGLRFQIIGPDGQPVTGYTEEHGKDLHLIVVRRDLTGFQHVHPTLDGAGTWSTTIDTSVPGPYRVFADFTPVGRTSGLTLGADLGVPGAYQPRALPADSRTADVDAYRVTMSGHLEPGTDSKITLTVSDEGQPVTDLDPYLEAYGHLVALRDGDLAYLHVHPAGGPGDGRTSAGPEITFYANIPSPGRYRLYLDFSHRGQVRTAEFTVTVDEH